MHRSTASRALNPATRHLVASEVALRVEAVARGLNYRRDDMAASLRTGRSATIGFVAPGLDDPAFAAVLAGLDAEIAGAGYALIVAAGRNGALARAVVDGLIALRVEALILAGARRLDPSVDLCLAAGMPVILVGQCEAEARVPSVAPDDRRGMRLALAHLVLLGHRRIGHVAGPQAVSTGALRRAGFEEAALLSGLSAQDAPVVEATAFTREAGAAAAGDLIDRHPGLTAIAAASDLLALGAYEALAARGLRCPGDV